jgi:WD40 repeat protein
VNLEQRQPDMILQGGNGVAEDYFTDRALDVQFVENNTQLLSVTGEGIVRRWDAQTGALIAETQLGQSFYGAAFSPDGGQLVYGVTTRDGVQIVPTPTARSIRPDGDDIIGIAWNSDGTEVAMGSADGDITIWNSSGELQTTFSSDALPVVDIA